MSMKTELQKVSEETMRFMRGKYALDEVPVKHYDSDCLKFRQGKRTILSINIHEDCYEFQIIFGKAERAKFETLRKEFPQFIVDIYDNAHTYHDGKWMYIRVDNIEILDVVKQLIMIKKKPNRKPFSKEGAVYADCGHRCDLCVHYAGGAVDEEFRKKLHKHVCQVYYINPDDEVPLCNGCSNGGIDGKFDCDQKICAKNKGVLRCMDCDEYACDKATVGWKPTIEPRELSADDVTWAILPYVEGQYGN